MVPAANETSVMGGMPPGHDEGVSQLEYPYKAAWAPAPKAISPSDSSLDPWAPACRARSCQPAGGRDAERDGRPCLPGQPAVQEERREVDGRQDHQRQADVRERHPRCGGQKDGLMRSLPRRARTVHSTSSRRLDKASALFSTKTGQSLQGTPLRTL